MKNNIIIAGVPRAGKSTMSHQLAVRYGYQHISMDSIIAGFEKVFRRPASTRMPVCPPWIRFA